LNLTPPETTQKYLHVVQLESVTSAKYLGVDISENLTWDADIDRKFKKADQTLGFLRRNIKFKSQSIKSIAYQTLVSPSLNMVSKYGLPTPKLK
jgi:hypothetical protein